MNSSLLFFRRQYQKKFFFIFLFLRALLPAQGNDVDRLMQSELKMIFPAIYFKHNSADYAAMPYTVDSCFKYIALNFDESINSLVIWRDSAETEILSSKRIQKLKFTLRKYIKKSKLEIYSMAGQQKISRYTIDKINDKSKQNYLLTLNSVFEISKTRIDNKTKYTNHIMRPSISCWGCWKSGFHWRSRMKIKKMQKRRENSK